LRVCKNPVPIFALRHSCWLTDGVNGCTLTQGRHLGARLRRRGATAGWTIWDNFTASVRVGFSEAHYGNVLLRSVTRLRRGVGVVAANSCLALPSCRNVTP